MRHKAGTIPYHEKKLWEKIRWLGSEVEGAVYSNNAGTAYSINPDELPSIDTFNELAEEVKTALNHGSPDKAYRNGYSAGQHDAKYNARRVIAAANKQGTIDDEAKARMFEALAWVR
jgi:hypothetical protein